MRWRFEKIDDDTRIGLDVPAWLGHYPEYAFLGMDVSVNARGVPVLQKDHPMTRDPDLRLLKPVDFHSSGWMPRAMRWHDELRALAGGRVPVGFLTCNRGCLDLAIQLRGFDNFARPALSAAAWAALGRRARVAPEPKSRRNLVTLPHRMDARVLIPAGTEVPAQRSKRP